MKTPKIWDRVSLGNLTRVSNLWPATKFSFNLRVSQIPTHCHHAWTRVDSLLWILLSHFTHETEGPWTLITLQALSLVKMAEPVQVRYFTLRLRDQRSMWMQDGCEVYMDSHMTSNGSCFMVTLIVLRNHLLEVGLTQDRETMAL